MASLITHGCVALLAGRGTRVVPSKSGRFWAAAVAVSCLPDIDVIGFRLGIPYGAFWGHRGFTHSLCFAALAATGAAVLAFPEIRVASRPWWRVAAFFFAVTASHGFLDAMTNGGRGIAFFSPFDNSRYFLPIRPLQVSPLGLAGFLTPLGLLILVNEFLVVLAPLYIGVRAIELIRNRPIATRSQIVLLLLLTASWIPLLVVLLRTFLE